MATADLFDGKVAEGFESVRDVFADGLTDFADGGGAFAVYWRGQPVIDLWAGMAQPERPWSEDTLAVLFSATKGITALAAHLLHARGELDVDATVATYWPEFAANGKAAITVRQVLTHTAGVLSFPRAAELLQPDGSGWADYDAIIAGLEAATPAWPPGSTHGYHMLTHGWLVGEIIRRITGVTVGQFVRDEIAAPLGLDLAIGTPVADHGRVAAISLAPAQPPPETLAFQAAIFSQMAVPGSLINQVTLTGPNGNLFSSVSTLFAEPKMLSAEVPAGNATGTARGLARLYAVLAGDGQLDGHQLLPAAAIEQWSEVAVRDVDAIYQEALDAGGVDLRSIAERTLGYFVNPTEPGQPPLFGPAPHAFGHDGFGGQLGFCDREHDLAVGFVRSALTSDHEFSRRLIDATYESLAAHD